MKPSPSLTSSSINPLRAIILLGVLVLLGACRGPDGHEGDPAGTGGSDRPAPTTSTSNPNSTAGDANATPTAEPQIAGEQLAQVVVAGLSLRLEIAADWESRGRGLSGRTSLAEDGGMIFIYPQAESRSYWMKDCLIGLDIAFVDSGGRLINLASLDPPGPATTNETMPRARSEGPARFVIETRKGWFAEHGIAAGAMFELPSDVIELARTGDADG